MTSCTMSKTCLWSFMLTIHLLLQCGDVELNPGPSLGYEVMKSCGKKIVEGLSRDPKGLALSLFEEKMISLDIFEKTNEQNDTNSDKARRLYIALLKRAEEHPQAYNKFVKVLEDCLYDDLREHLLGEYQKASPPCGIVLEPQAPSLTEDRKTVRSGSLAASDYSSPPTSPLSESLGSASSSFSSLTADSFTKSKDRRVDTLRDKNITAIRHHFYIFLQKVERGLIECNVDFTSLKRYLNYYYQDCPNFDDISSYFEHLTQSQKWDYMNSEHLCEIVKTFGNNKTLLDDVREFRERKSTYLAYITISEYIEDKAKMSQLVSKSRRHRGRKRRGSKSYRDELSVKLDVAVTTTTLKYIEDLWRDLSYLNLPKIGVILEDIIGGCVWVVWVITLQTIVTDFRKKAKQPEAAEFFKRHEIVRVYFNDECLYSAEGEELTDFIRNNILKQLTSDSIDEEPEDEVEYDCSQQVEENSEEAIDAQTVCEVVGEDETAEDGLLCVRAKQQQSGSEKESEMATSESRAAAATADTEYIFSTLIEQISQEIPPDSLMYRRVCFVLAAVLPDNAPKTLLKDSNLLSAIYNQDLKDRAEGCAKFWYVLKETCGCSDDLLQQLRRQISKTYILPKEMATQLHLRVLILKVISEIVKDQDVATGLINTAGATLTPQVRLAALSRPDNNDYTLPLLEFFEKAEQQCAVEPDDLSNLRQWLTDAGCMKIIKKYLNGFDHKKEIRILSADRHPIGMTSSAEEKRVPTQEESEFVPGNMMSVLT